MKNILFPSSLSEQRRCTKRAVIASAIKFDWLTGKKVVYIRKTSSRYVIGQPNFWIKLGQTLPRLQGREDLSF